MVRYNSFDAVRHAALTAILGLWQVESGLPGATVDVDGILFVQTQVKVSENISETSTARRVDVDPRQVIRHPTGITDFLRDASLDESAVSESYVQSRGHLLHHRHVGGGSMDAMLIGPTEAKLGPFGRVCQSLPVIVVILLSAGKMQQIFVRQKSVALVELAEVTLALVLYLVSGPTVILVNKHVMHHYSFHFPVLLASLGNLFLMCVTRGMVALGLHELQTKQLPWERYFQVVLPINLCNFLTQVLGMYAYLFISVPQIQILKSTTIVLVLFLAVLLVREPISWKLVTAVFVIAGGVCLSAIFDADGNIAGGSNRRIAIGVTLSMLASFFEAAKTVLSQVLMNKLTVFDGIYWASPTFCGIAAIVVCSMELRGLVHFPFSGVLCFFLVVNALLTGLIVLSSFWFVKLAGALTLKVVTQARSIGLVLCSVLFFREHCSRMQYVGYTITLVGMGLFDHAKQLLAKGSFASARSPTSGGAGPR